MVFYILAWYFAYLILSCMVFYIINTCCMVFYILAWYFTYLILSCMVFYKINTCYMVLCTVLYCVLYCAVLCAVVRSLYCTHRLSLGLLCLREVEIHLVSVEVSIVRCTRTLVEAKGLPWHYLGTVRHD